jgi:hypothetical protein
LFHAYVVVKMSASLSQAPLLPLLQSEEEEGLVEVGEEGLVLIRQST